MGNITRSLLQIRQSRVLHSWKAIAEYMDVGVRTAQRWEAAFGLPVSRPAGPGRGAVIAVTDDLDEWSRLGHRANAINSDPYSLALTLMQALTHHPSSSESEELTQSLRRYLADAPLPFSEFLRVMDVLAPLTVASSRVSETKTVVSISSKD